MIKKDELKKLYFDWLCHFVEDGKHKTGYRKLLLKLHNISYTYVNDMDRNRRDDGLGLRWEFAHETNIGYIDVMYSMDYAPCTFLEMLVALCVRCENELMSDSSYGNRTALWFWEIMSNMHLGSMKDPVYDGQIVYDIAKKVMRCGYESDGTDGYFYIEDCQIDLRTADIWYQLQLWLADLERRNSW